MQSSSPGKQFPMYPYPQPHPGILSFGIFSALLLKPLNRQSPESQSIKPQNMDSPNPKPLRIKPQNQGLTRP